MDKSKSLSQSELYKSTHASFEDVMNLLDENSKEGYDKAVRLTRKEIAQGRNNKRVAREKTKTFANTPIYRSYHQAPYGYDANYTIDAEENRENIRYNSGETMRIYTLEFRCL